MHIACWSTGALDPTGTKTDQFVTSTTSRYLCLAVPGNGDPQEDHSKEKGRRERKNIERGAGRNEDTRKRCGGSGAKISSERKREEERRLGKKEEHMSDRKKKRSWSMVRECEDVFSSCS